MTGATTNGTPSLMGLIVRLDPWCGMACGESRACVCNPTTMARDFKNRAQRHAAAKAARRAKL